MTTLSVRAKAYGTMFEHTGPGTHTKALACIWKEVDKESKLPVFQGFRATYGDDSGDLLSGLEEFKEESFDTMEQAVLWATPPELR